MPWHLVILHLLIINKDHLLVLAILCIKIDLKITYWLIDNWPSLTCTSSTFDLKISHGTIILMSRPSWLWCVIRTLSTCQTRSGQPNPHVFKSIYPWSLFKRERYLEVHTYSGVFVFVVEKSFDIIIHGPITEHRVPVRGPRVRVCIGSRPHLDSGSGHSLRVWRSLNKR